MNYVCPTPWDIQEIAKVLFKYISEIPSVYKLVILDLTFWKSVTNKSNLSNQNAFIELFSTRQEFRHIINYRVDKYGGSSSSYNEITECPNWFHVENLHLSCARIGGGLYIEHGFTTIVLANKIGKNFWVNQNVTIGSGRNGNPTIGDNVQVRTGAVIVGGINIGCNVKIGANAFVDFDVPDNTIVVTPRASMIPMKTIN